MAVGFRENNAATMPGSDPTPTTGLTLQVACGSLSPGRLAAFVIAGHDPGSSPLPITPRLPEPDQNRCVFLSGVASRLGRAHVCLFLQQGRVVHRPDQGLGDELRVSTAIASMRSTQGRHVKECIAAGGWQIYSQPCQTFGPSSSRWRPGASDVPLWMVTFGLCPSYGRVRPGRLFLSRLQGGSFLQSA